MKVINHDMPEPYKYKTALAYLNHALLEKLFYKPVSTIKYWIHEKKCDIEKLFYNIDER
ncbi:hypothetical protein [Mammaliicoccus lentus]|uniref:hypothetical protein n=1 Tax=Mammaliicoccus lentus TaxID=42858 RepID=UPI001B319B2A|nr:hypothetical protein [Mammaliicoccus lentus]